MFPALWRRRREAEGGESVGIGVRGWLNLRELKGKLMSVCVCGASGLYGNS